MQGHTHTARCRTPRGQTAVETAIVMPLFLFLIFGTFQLGLAHQARIMTKYAAYKAVRAGAIHNAKHSVMRFAALAVLVPFIGREGTGGKIGKFDSVFKAASDSDYTESWSRLQSLKTINNVNYLTVTICEPHTARVKELGDFDNPDWVVAGFEKKPESDDSDPDVASEDAPPSSGGGDDWAGFNKTRLAVQVTFMYKLVIPFANAALFWVTVGKAREEYLKAIRLGHSKSDWEKFRRTKDARFDQTRVIDTVLNQAKQGNYYLPIRASFAMRMQSSFLQGAEFALPGRNKCYVGWKPAGE